MPPGAPRRPLGASPGPGEAPGAPRRLPREAPGESHLNEKKTGKSPGGPPRALGERFLEAPNVLLRALGFQIVFRTALGSKKVAREASGTLKIKVFV